MSSTQPQGPVEDPSPIITLSRNIALRLVRHSDAEDMSRMANNRKLLRNMKNTWPDPYTIDGAHEFIAKTRNRSDWYPIGPKPKQGEDDRKKLPVGWAIVQNDKLIGTVGIKVQTDILVRMHSFGYWIGEEHWGQGIATEVVTAFTKWMWEMYPDIVRLEASAYSWNPASARVLQKAGFVLEGRAQAKVWKCDELCDLLQFGMVREGVTTA